MNESNGIGQNDSNDNNLRLMWDFWFEHTHEVELCEQ